MSEPALVKLSDFGFLKGIDNADAITTPLEAEEAKMHRFADYTTGTMKLPITPEMLEQCSVLRTICITTELKRLASVVAQLQATFRVSNSIRALVDPALIARELPFNDNLADFTDDMIDRSTMTIEFIDATPTIEGIPVWERMKGERLDFHNVFKLYRDSRYLLLTTGEYVIVNRTLAGLSRQLGIPGVILTYISKVYSWPARCELYDAYMELITYKRRAQEVQILQNDHLHIANELCKKAFTYLNNNSASLCPKEALQMLELGIKYSRVSVGLLPDKPGSVAANSQTNLSIYANTTNNTADKMLNIHAGGNTTDPGAGSSAERQLQADIKDDSNLLSILHVLQASGAMKTAIHADLLENGDTEGLGIVVEEEVVY